LVVGLLAARLVDLVVRRVVEDAHALDDQLLVGPVELHLAAPGKGDGLVELVVVRREGRAADGRERGTQEKSRDRFRAHTFTSNVAARLSRDPELLLVVDER